MSDKTTAGQSSTAFTRETARISSETEQRPPVALNSPAGQECLKQFFRAQFELNHDLNNPLAGVVGYLELAMADADSIPPRAVELLRNAQKCANRIDELIQEFVKSKRHLQNTVDLSDVLSDEH